MGDDWPLRQQLFKQPEVAVQPLTTSRVPERSAERSWGHSGADIRSVTCLCEVEFILKSSIN